MEHTQIQITKETRERLKKIKLTKRESYEEIINRLLDFYEIKNKPKNETN